MKGWTLQLSALAVPLLGNMMGVCIWLPLLNIPAGGKMHACATPEAAALICVAGGTLFGGGLIATWLWATGRKLAALLCVFFSLTPFPLSLITASYLVSLRNLH